MCLTSRGAYPNQGWTLQQAAEFMKENGAVIAFDSGAGGDVTEVIDGVLTNIPENIVGGLHVQRALPQFLLIHAGETMTEPTEAYYEYIATGNNRAIRIGPGATYSRIASNSDFFVNTKAKGGATPADRVTLDSATATLVQGLAGDVWVAVYDNNGKAVVGWTAKTHKGLAQLTEKLVPAVVETPTEPTLPASWEVIQVAKDEAGNVVATYKGTLAKQ
jgi:hypothetical protein